MSVDTSSSIRGLRMGHLSKIAGLMPSYATCEPFGPWLDGAMWACAEEWARAYECWDEDCGCEGDIAPHIHSAFHHRAESARIMNFFPALYGVGERLRLALADHIVHERVDAIRARIAAGERPLTPEQMMTQRGYLTNTP